MFERELRQFAGLLQQLGRREDEFTTTQTFLPPEDAADGMFPLRYEVSVTAPATGKTAVYVGGIGLDWVGEFEEDLRGGRFS